MQNIVHFKQLQSDSLVHGTEQNQQLILNDIWNVQYLQINRHAYIVDAVFINFISLLVTRKIHVFDCQDSASFSVQEGGPQWLRQTAECLRTCETVERQSKSTVRIKDIKYSFKRKKFCKEIHSSAIPCKNPMALGPPLALAAVSTSSSMIFACIVAQFGSSGSYCNPQKSNYILKHLDVWYIVRCLLSGSALQMHVFSLSSPSDHIFPHVFENLHHIWSYLHLPCSAPVQLLWHHECHSFPGHSLRTNLPLLLTGRTVPWTVKACAYESM